MKTVTLFIFAMALLYLNHGRDKFLSTTKQRQSLKDYKVYKIDSVNDFYLIYARKGKTIYKIVSHKEVTDCKSIQVNGHYGFELHSYLYINGHLITPKASSYETDGIYVDDKTIIRFEGDSIRDLFYADNIKSLCFIQR